MRVTTVNLLIMALSSPALHFQDALAFNEQLVPEAKLNPAPFTAEATVVFSSLSATRLEISVSVVDKDRLPASDDLALGLVVIAPTGNVEPVVLEANVAPVSDPQAVSAVVPSAAPVSSVRVGSAGIWRDIRVVDVSVAPCWVSENGPVIARRLLIEIRNTGGVGVNEKTSPARPISPIWDRLYRRHVLNYDCLDLERLTRGTGNRYLVISRTLFDTETPQFVEWKTRQGYGIEVVTLESLGYTDPQDTAAINATKSYIWNAYNTWPEGLDFVLLVGDMYQGNLSGSIWTKTYYDYFYDYGNMPYDQWYAFLEGNDLFADVLLGRFPDTNTERMNYELAKTIAYEKSPHIEDAWQRNALMTLTTDIPETQSSKSLVSDRLSEWGMNVTECFDSPYMVTPIINHGITFFNYRGDYSDRSNWGEVFGSDDVPFVNNPHKPGVWIGICCETAAFHYSSASLPELLLRHDYTNPSEPRGAVAIIGTQGLGSFLYNNPLDEGIYLAWTDSIATLVGQALLSGKIYMWNHLPSGFDPNRRDCVMKSNTVLGDPSLQVWTDVPADVTVTAFPETVAVGLTTDIDITVETLSSSPVEGALVCMWRSNEVYVYGYTGTDGVTALPVTPVTEGVIDLTVTAYDVMPYLGEILAALMPIPKSPESVEAEASGTDLVLTWSPVTEDMLGNPITVDWYEIYRLIVPHFLVSDLSPVGSPVDTTFIDSGAVGNVEINYYYRVVAVSTASGSSPPSLPVGEIDFLLEQ